MPPPSSSTRTTIGPSLGTALDGDADARRLAVADRIAEALLHDPIDHQVDGLAETLDAVGDVDAIADVRIPAPPELDEIVDRGGEPEFLEADGAQPAQHVAHLSLHMADRVGDRAQMLGDLAGAAGLDRAGNIGDVDVDAEQERSDLVVKIARDVAALLLLQGQELAGEAAVLLRHPAQLARHAVEAVAQAREFGRQPAFDTDAVLAAADRRQAPR